MGFRWWYISFLDSGHLDFSPFASFTIPLTLLIFNTVTPAGERRRYVVVGGGELAEILRGGGDSDTVHLLRRCTRAARNESCARHTRVGANKSCARSSSALLDIFSPLPLP